MDGFVCANCNSWLGCSTVICPECGTELVTAGDTKNIIDQLQPNCLIHRYEGSDLLEPAVLLKEGKTNVKVATRLIEYQKPVTVSKAKVFGFDPAVYSSIQALRNERTATVNRYDHLIGSHWQRLKPYNS